MEYSDLFQDIDEQKSKKIIYNPAPIVLFTYNRLEHTQKTIAALQQNTYAQESELYIYSDASKNEAAKESVEQVRAFLHKVDGFKKVHIIEREENWGLARNIIDGVTKIVNQYGKIIVLEDDIFTSPHFLQYMNEALELYKDNSNVMEISGFTYPIGKEGLPDSFFVKLGACWGWATWDRAWHKFRRDPVGVMDSFTKNDIYHFTLEGKWQDVWKQLQKNKSGKLYTWAVYWFAAIYLNDGYVLYPKVSMTNNIGMDGSGEHCGTTDAYMMGLAKEKMGVYPTKIEESVIARRRMGNFFYELQPSAIKIIFHRMKVALIGDVPIRNILKKWS